jgi:hypothetical protein
MNNNSCNICCLNSPIFILNCGCFVCSDCYEVIRSFIEEDKEICYSCEKEIILSMTIDLKKKNIISQITKYNTKENNDIILSKLKVSYNFFIFIF